MERLLIDLIVVAVNLYIHQLQRLFRDDPTAFVETVEEWCQPDIPTIIYRAANIGNQETWEGFDITGLAKAVAALSFYHGGIKVFFNHWQSTPIVTSVHERIIKEQEPKGTPIHVFLPSEHDPDNGSREDDGLE
jgi:hypothetical protein